MQTEVAECGIACMAMVANYFGYHCDVHALRKKFSASLKGMNLKHLLLLGERCGLIGRPLRCEIDELDQLQLPAILHWDLNHYVVLTKVSKRSVTIHDPAVGQVKKSLDECSRSFTGIVLEVSPGADFKPRKEKQKLSIWQFWHRMNHVAQSLGYLLGLSLLLQILALAGPYYMQWVIDHVLVTHDRELLVVLALGFGLVMLCNIGLGCLRSYLVLRITAVINLKMGVNLTQHLLRLPLDYFAKRHVGDVVSRFSSLGQVRERLTTGVVETVVDGMMAILLLIVMLLYSVPLTALVLGSVTLFVVFRSLTYGALYRSSEQLIKFGADEQTNFLENIRGIQAIKLQVAENQRRSLWQNRYTALINSEIRHGKLNIGFSVGNGLIFGVENILLIYLAAGEVLSGALTVGMMLAFITYKGQLTSRLTALVEQWIAFRMLRLHLDRLADIALTEPESDFSSEVIDAPPYHVASGDSTKRNDKKREAAPTLEVKDLSFAYGDNETQVLSDINFRIAPGSMVALVGGSGSGKSTLVKLLLGLYQASQGHILVDGVDIHSQGLIRYRSRVAAVMQGDTLLSGSVAENISFYDINPDLEEIVACAKASAIHKDIQALPMGYQSLVGDMGSQFSGGQVQRLLLARALYRKPDLLVLDEATSHLDVHNERLVSQFVRELGMTRLVVAHRPSTIQGADKIIYLEAGQAIEMDSAEYIRFIGSQGTAAPAVNR